MTRVTGARLLTLPASVLACGLLLAAASATATGQKGTKEKEPAKAPAGEVMPFGPVPIGIAAGDGPARVKLARRAKAAVALVEVKGPGKVGSAFCLHPSGLFLTCAPFVQGDVTLVLSPGQKAEKAWPARVIRRDPEQDLALLRVEGVKDLAALPLGSDAELVELAAVWAFGCALGPAPVFCASPATVRALPGKDARPPRIQLNAVLDGGQCGGPVLDARGQVIGVIAAVQGPVGLVIPASTVARFLAPPEVQFDQPQLDPVAISRPIRFHARLTPFLPSAAPYTVDLIVTPPRGPERKYPMHAEKDGYRVTTPALAPPPGPLTLRLVAQFDDGTLKGTTADREFKVGDRELKLSEVVNLRPGAVARVGLQGGEKVEGAASGLGGVPLLLGGKTLSVNLARAREVTVTRADESDQVAYTLVVRQGDREVYRQRQSVTGPGLKYLLLPISQVAPAVSTKSMFTGNGMECLIFPKWGKQEVHGIPFDVVDPRGDRVKNAIVLHGPAGAPARDMPTAVRLKCGSAAKAIHLLSGVAGWGYTGGNPSPCMIVRLHYRDGSSEDHPLMNGIHFCDFSTFPNDRPFEVPGSRFAIRFRRPDGGAAQIRYLAIQPRSPGKVIDEIEFVKDPAGGNVSPVIMAVTVEKPGPGGVP
jgi:hypothetical protein